MTDIAAAINTGNFQERQSTNDRGSIHCCIVLGIRPIVLGKGLIGQSTGSWRIAEIFIMKSYYENTKKTFANVNNCCIVGPT
jgi:CO dehydrogenase/acetyl-CoA synthase epsilon subunit